MEEPKPQVLALVKVPLLTVEDVRISAYVRSLVRNHLDELETRPTSEACLTLMVDACHHIVILTCTRILEAIKPVTSHWHRKAPRIFDNVFPEMCVFGVEEKDVTAKMEHVLPRSFARSLGISEVIPCESLDIFIQLVSKEITEKVNSRINLILKTQFFCYPLKFDCNCIKYTTLVCMIGYAFKILKCLRRKKCECICDHEMSDMEKLTFSSDPKDRMEDGMKLESIDMKLGNYEVTYTSANQKAMEILLDFSDFIRLQGMEENNFSVDNYRTSANEDYPSSSSSENMGLRDEEGSLQYDTDYDESSIESFQSNENSESSHCVSNTLQSVTDDVKKRELFILLLAGLLLHTQKRAQTILPQSDFNTIVNNLRDKALASEIHHSDIAVSSTASSVEKCNKALFKDLCGRFGSAKELLRALKTQVADDVVIEAFKAHVTMKSSLLGRVTKFFSRVGKNKPSPFESTAAVALNHQDLL
ncbi:uncharacterized protein LOC128769700 [Synchiropus splendidus]|uniref:uncharacterized protein LOC128769700 n=1 Tax=Synchiropus splendidus TaxID=270530 RepID=UPI00237DD0C6|nr:uncharacterized protein LOC128769700 [Synchiropus splendidus]